jgi:hypothetical protein
MLSSSISGPALRCSEHCCADADDRRIQGMRPIRRPVSNGGFQCMPPLRICRSRGAAACHHLRRCSRRLIGERGLHEATMRHLADEGDASIQTLYNPVGNRERIIVEALKELIGAMSAFADSGGR